MLDYSGQCLIAQTTIVHQNLWNYTILTNIANNHDRLWDLYGILTSILEDSSTPSRRASFCCMTTLLLCISSHDCLVYQPFCRSISIVTSIFASSFSEL